MKSSKTIQEARKKTYKKCIINPFALSLVPFKLGFMSLSLQVHFSLLLEEGSSSKEGINMRVRGFWMEGNLDVLEHGDYMKKFVWGEIEPFHCGMVGNFGIWCFTEM